MLRLASLIMQRPAKPCSLVVNSASPWDSEGGHASRAATHPSYGVLWRKWFALVLSRWHALHFLCASVFCLLLWFLRPAWRVVTFCSFRSVHCSFRSPLRTCRLAAEALSTGLQTRGLSISKLILRNKDTASFFIPEGGKAEDIARQLGWAAQRSSAQRESLSNLSLFPLVPEITVTTWEFLQTSPLRTGCWDLFLGFINECGKWKKKKGGR